jgi:hypothetical protein
MTASMRNDVVNHSLRLKRLAANMKQALPAMEASETVKRYCFAWSRRRP